MYHHVSSSVPERDVCHKTPPVSRVQRHFLLSEKCGQFSISVGKFYSKIAENMLRRKVGLSQFQQPEA